MILTACADGPLGILGAGSMGRSMAQKLLEKGFPADRLLVSHGASKRTRAELEKIGLEESIVSSKELATRSRLLIVAVRPADAGMIPTLPLREDALLISVMAGKSVSNILPGNTGARAARVMPSAPFTLEHDQGIAGVFENGINAAGAVVRFMGLQEFVLEAEETFHAFTALGVCLPMALTLWYAHGRRVDFAALLTLAETYSVPDFPAILAWAERVRPHGLGEKERSAFLAEAATPGGVTQAILDAINAGKALPEALVAGLARSRQLGAG
jgi:pyrroline-5-carboxylate reductase